MSINIWRVISNKLLATHLTTNFCTVTPQWGPGVPLQSAWPVFLGSSPTPSPSTHTHHTSCPFLTLSQGSTALLLHLERPPHCLGQSLTLSEEPLPTFCLFHSSLDLWGLSIYLKMYHSCLWIAGLCVAFISSLIFQIFFFPTMYLSYNYLHKWKKQLPVLRKKTKNMVVILCLSLPLCHGIVKARNQVFFVLSSKLRTSCVLVVCQENEWMRRGWQLSWKLKDMIQTSVHHPESEELLVSAL